MASGENIQSLLGEHKKQVLVMGEMVERALGLSIEALKKRDLNLGHQIIADDAKISKEELMQIIESL